MKSRRDVISERKRAKVRVLSRAAAIPTLRQSQQLFATHRALGWSGGVAGVTFERWYCEFQPDRLNREIAYVSATIAAYAERRTKDENAAANRWAPIEPGQPMPALEPDPRHRRGSRDYARAPGRMRRPGENLPGPGRGSFRRGLDSRKLARSQLPRWQARGRKSEASLRADPLARLRRAERPGRGAAPRPVISLSP